MEVVFLHQLYVAHLAFLVADGVGLVDGLRRHRLSVDHSRDLPVALAVGPHRQALDMDGRVPSVLPVTVERLHHVELGLDGLCGNGQGRGGGAFP